MDPNAFPIEHTTDILVIGGGINGTGIARDCALRGWPVCLIEKDDFGQGTTGGCSGMIHGGVKYLVDSLAVTRKSCLDSGYIQKTLPHLLFRIPMVYPIPSRLGGALGIELFETYFELYDRYVGLKNGRPHTRLTPEEVRELEPLVDVGKISGAITLDEWGLNPYRACAVNARGAAESGAAIRNHTQLVRFTFEEGTAPVRRLTGALVRHALSGRIYRIAARLTVNAAGPWSPMVAALAGAATSIRPSKGVHLVFDRRITNAGLLFNAIDGRSIFIIPYESTSILGTTDDDFFGDPDRVDITHDEVEYLLRSAETIFPDIRKFRIMRAFAALRPTLYRFGKNENDLSRDHRLYDHEALGEVRGLISLIGGKYAAYRFMSEETTDLVGARLGRQAACTTGARPLPGGESLPDVAALADRYRCDPLTVARAVAKYGTRAERIFQRMQSDPESRRMICPCEMVTRAEIAHVMEEEWAATPSDVLRRTRCGWGNCQGTRCALPLEGEVMRGRPSDAPGAVRRDLAEFFEYGHRNRYPILSGHQLRQEELMRGQLLGAANLAAWLV